MASPSRSGANSRFASVSRGMRNYRLGRVRLAARRNSCLTVASRFSIVVARVSWSDISFSYPSISTKYTGRPASADRAAVCSR